MGRIVNHAAKVNNLFKYPNKFANFLFAAAPLRGKISLFPIFNVKNKATTKAKNKP